MIKNIAVIDEQGNRYEATYPKRAKGLVKSGRARFVNENTICLARPPYKSEDKTMSENMGSENFSFEYAGSENTAGKKDASGDLKVLEEELKKKAVAYLDQAAQKADADPEKELQDKPLNREIVEKVLDQLDHFAVDDAYIATLAEKHIDGEDMTSIVRLREATRQRQLDVYRTVLEKAIANEANVRVNSMKQLEQITDWISGLDRDDFDQDMWDMIKTKAFELINRTTSAV